MPRWGMVIDLRRCIGCNACTEACKAEHGTPPGIFFTRVLVKETGTYPAVRRLYIPVLCNHCQNAPCEEVCPTEATHRWDGGVVLVDSNKCMGCRACYEACPYQNRFYLDGDLLSEGYFCGELTPFEEVKYQAFEKGTVVKCNFCVHRLEKGLPPACVVTCLTEARIFGDLEDPNSQVSRLISEERAVQLLPECDTNPSVFYILPPGFSSLQEEKN